MTESDYARALDELGWLLNDPSAPAQPGLVWRVLDRILEMDRSDAGPRSGITANG
jgi:hypothetical protein